MPADDPFRKDDERPLGPRQNVDAGRQGLPIEPFAIDAESSGPAKQKTLQPALHEEVALAMMKGNVPACRHISPTTKGSQGRQ